MVYKDKTTFFICRGWWQLQNKSTTFQSPCKKQQRQFRQTKSSQNVQKGQWRETGCSGNSNPTTTYTTAGQVVRPCKMPYRSSSLITQVKRDTAAQCGFPIYPQTSRSWHITGSHSPDPQPKMQLGHSQEVYSQHRPKEHFQAAWFRCAIVHQEQRVYRDWIFLESGTISGFSTHICYLCAFN